MLQKKFLDEIKNKFLKNIPQNVFASLRLMKTDTEVISVRQNVLEPIQSSTDQGLMISLIKENGFGYGATYDLSENGIKKAIDKALYWCEVCKKYPLVDYNKIKMPAPKGEYKSNVKTQWTEVSLKEKIDLLSSLCREIKISDNIVDWSTLLWQVKQNIFYLTSTGGESFQDLSYIIPNIQAVANKGSETQIRTLQGMMALSRQGGFEVLSDIGFKAAAKKIAQEALELLEAPNCPTGKMDLVLDPNQMLLQIHESIGHPLEIDRILGDERNYAGTSFVTPEMFGNYQYGSELLNIVFDPTRKEQLASYAFDDDGNEAKKEYLIEKGILQRGLGSNISQARSGLKGVSCSRVMNWNRPPIDRMANVNLEPGTSSFDEIVASVENGIYMDSNTSWSIDDSRNKFQFGCERGQLIENGKLTKIVKKPNYRGISATFWRNLKMVGNSDTFKVMGTPHCGKGEPNQVISVGHASPVCLFAGVDVFGGE